MKTIKEIASNLLLDKVKPYIKYDTLTAKHYGFMCLFNESQDFGINLINIEVSDALNFLRQTDNFVLQHIKDQIVTTIGHYKDIYIIYFFLFHEEGHWIEFLESNMTSSDYCKSITINDYNGSLKNLRGQMSKDVNNQDLKDQYNLLYRSTAYEQRADNYAMKRLEHYIEINL